MSSDFSTGLLFATTLAVFTMIVMWGLPMGAISITRSITALRVRRERHLRRSAFHRRLRKQGLGTTTRGQLPPRDQRRAT